MKLITAIQNHACATKSAIVFNRKDCLRLFIKQYFINKGNVSETLQDRDIQCS